MKYLEKINILRYRYGGRTQIPHMRGRRTRSKGTWCPKQKKRAEIQRIQSTVTSKGRKGDGIINIIKDYNNPIMTRKKGRTHSEILIAVLREAERCDWGFKGEKPKPNHEAWQDFSTYKVRNCGGGGRGNSRQGQKKDLTGKKLTIQGPQRY